MDITQIICTVITGIIGIIVALIGAQITSSRREESIRNDRLKKESMLSLEMIHATLQLSVVCANALTGGHNNGNVEEARQKALKAEQSYLAFEREVLSEELVK